MKRIIQHALVTGAAAVGLFAASGAQANVYNFVLDGCTGGCGASPATPVGSVVTELESPGVIGVTLTLTSGAFHDAKDPQHHALVFDLAGAPKISISDLGSPFTANGSQSAGSVDASPFGTFEYVINFPHQKNPPVETTLSFDVTAVSGPALTLSSFLSNGNAFFASDIWANANQSGNGGNVGALAAGVPEPATWALMIAGFAGICFTGLRKAKIAAAFAA
jgi:hypothetical protein